MCHGKNHGVTTIDALQYDARGGKLINYKTKIPYQKFYYNKIAVKFGVH